jgi:hypothetical protein
MPHQTTIRKPLGAITAAQAAKRTTPKPVPTDLSDVNKENVKGNHDPNIQRRGRGRTQRRGRGRTQRRGRGRTQRRGRGRGRN